MARMVILGILLVSLAVSLFSQLTVVASSKARCQVRVEFIHGGHYDGASDDDWKIAWQFAEQLMGDPNCGIALSVKGARLAEILGLPEDVGRLVGETVVWGAISKRSVVYEQAADLEHVPDGGSVIKVGYSAGGGAVLDLTMGRHLAPDVAEDWEELLRRYSRENVGLAVVAVDPYLGRVIPDLELMPLLKAPALNEFLQDPQHHITVVKFGKPASHLSNEEVKTIVDQFVGEDDSSWLKWVGKNVPGEVREVLKETFDDPITLGYKQIQRLSDYLSPESASRLTLVDQSADLRLGQLWHSGIKESLPVIANTLHDTLPQVNLSPQMVSGDLSGSLTVYLCPDRIGGKKAVLLGSVSITDPDGDALRCRLQSQPRYGFVNPIIGGSSLYGTYQFFASKEDLIRPCCNHDDLVDHFSVAGSDGHSGEVSIPGTVTIHVVDATFPDVITQNITVDLDENGQASIAPQEIDNGSTDNCGIARMTLDKDTFTCADLGANTVTLTVTDTSSNSASGQATITVVDNIPPILTVPPNVTIECGESTDPSHTGQASAADNCDPNPQITYSNSTSGSCPTLISRTWTATDASGNSTTGIQQITVEDTTPPTVNCPGNITVETHDPSGTTVTYIVTAMDTCDPHPRVTCTPTSGSHFPVGTTTVTCTATDACGNKSARCHFTVTVNFVNHPPVAYNGKYFVLDWSQPVSIHLNADDQDEDPLTYSIVTHPGHGFLSGTPPNLVYTHEGGGIPVDWFTFRVFDGYDYSNVATIVIDPPIGTP